MFLTKGTGFAPIKAMIEQLITNGDQRPLHLFWACRLPNDLYLENIVRQWQKALPFFSYTPIILNPEQSDALDSFTLNYYDDLSSWQIILSGSSDMVYKTREGLMRQGALLKHIHSDVFDLE